MPWLDAYTLYIVYILLFVVIAAGIVATATLAKNKR